MADDKFFPQIRKGLEDFMNEEEGNISRSKVAMIGSMMVILGMMELCNDADFFHPLPNLFRLQPLWWNQE